MQLDHIGIAVTSIEQARTFYERGLSLPAAPHIEGVAGEQVRVLKLQCGQAAHIELLEPTSPDSPIARFIAKRGAGLHHLCYRTDDIGNAITRLRGMGFKPLWDAPHDGADGAKVMFFHPKEAFGVLTEVAQYPATCGGWVVSVNTNAGGVPKIPRPQGDRLTANGFETDQQGHEKHRKPTRAVSVLSVELLEQFQREGFKVAPGIMAENVTVIGVDLCALKPGARFVFDGGATLEVASQRKPCYQLNPMGEGLEQAAVGRSGVMCSVIREGEVKPGMRFTVTASALPAAV